MSGLLIDNVGALVTNDPSLGAGPLGLIEDAAIVFEDGVVRWAGPRRATPEAAADERVDAGGRALIPGFVDSHAHLVFAGDRTAEFVARMSGEAYEAGGIRTTVAATRAAPSEALERNMAPARGRGAQVRHHDDRVQVGLRADRGGRAPQRRDRRRATPTR